MDNHQSNNTPAIESALGTHSTRYGLVRSAKDSGEGAPFESYSQVQFVLRRMTNPRIADPPYWRGPLVVWRSVSPGWERRKVHRVTRQLFGGGFIPSVVGFRLSDATTGILNIRHRVSAMVRRLKCQGFPRLNSSVVEVIPWNRASSLATSRSSKHGDWVTVGSLLGVGLCIVVRCHALGKTISHRVRSSGGGYTARVESQRVLSRSLWARIYGLHFANGMGTCRGVRVFILDVHTANRCENIPMLGLR